MSTLRDISNVTFLPNTFLGACRKSTVLLDGKRYLMKFSEENTKQHEPLNETSSINVPISEYLGCHIYDSIGIDTQDTILASYKGDLVVLCKDFRYINQNEMYYRKYDLQEFKSLENSTYSSSDLGRCPQYEQLKFIYDTNTFLDGIRELAKNRYREMLLIDGLIGNFDRHSGNWGFLINQNDPQEILLAPVYDCGSALSPLLSDEGMQNILNKPGELEVRIKIRPKAKLMVKDNQVGYLDFLLSDEGADCRQVLLDLYDKIDLAKINSIIDNLPEVSDTRKEYYSKFIAARKEGILKPAYELALKESREVKAPSVMNATAKEVALKNSTSSEDINHGPNL